MHRLEPIVFFRRGPLGSRGVVLLKAEFYPSKDGEAKKPVETVESEEE